MRSNGFGRAACAVRHLVPNKVHVHEHVPHRSELSIPITPSGHSRVTQRSVWREHCPLEVGGSVGEWEAEQRAAIDPQFTAVRLEYLPTPTTLVRAVVNLFYARGPAHVDPTADAAQTPAHPMAA